MARGNLPAGVGERVWKILPHRCVFCGIRPGDTTSHLGPAKHFVIEHLTPRLRGGTAAPENLTLACSSCNRKKLTQTMAEFGFACVPTLAQPDAPSVRWSDPDMDYELA